MEGFSVPALDPVIDCSHARDISRPTAVTMGGKPLGFRDFEISSAASTNGTEWPLADGTSEQKNVSILFGIWHFPPSGTEGFSQYAARA